MANEIPMVSELFQSYKDGTLPKTGSGIFECYLTEGHREADSRGWITYEFIEKAIKLEKQLKNNNE